MKFTKLWKHIGNLSCYHTKIVYMTSLLLTLSCLLSLMYAQTTTKEGKLVDIFPGVVAKKNKKKKKTTTTTNSIAVSIDSQTAKANA